jgi:Uma2 family endonuclease
MTAEEYDRAAQDYLASLPLEHFAEATPHATQRQITVQSLKQIEARRPDVHVFNELLVQYHHNNQLRQVVPDNMVVLGELDDHGRTNYAVELEPARLLWTIDYVSAGNKRKDYADHFRKYEQELKVPYYLIYNPDTQDLRLYRHDGSHYALVEANTQGRWALPELELEIALLGRWVRFWHREKMLLLPAEIQEELEKSRRLFDEQANRLKELKQQAEDLIREKRRLSEQDKRLRERDKQLSERDQAMQTTVNSLRPLVEVRARQAGRQDILEQLPGITDGQLLAHWLAELG